jgi:hypothetical protein
MGNLPVYSTSDAPKKPTGHHSTAQAPWDHVFKKASWSWRETALGVERVAIFSLLVPFLDGRSAQAFRLCIASTVLVARSQPRLVRRVGVAVVVPFLCPCLVQDPGPIGDVTPLKQVVVRERETRARAGRLLLQP